MFDGSTAPLSLNRPRSDFSPLSLNLSHHPSPIITQNRQVTGLTYLHTYMNLQTDVCVPLTCKGHGCTHTQTHTQPATIAVMEGHRLMPLESVNEMNEQGGGELLGALGEG